METNDAIIDMEKKMNDFICEALVTAQFVANCGHPSNAGKSAKEIKEKLESKAKISVLNPATFISIAYFLFVIIHETEKKTKQDMLDYSKLSSINKKLETIKEWDKKGNVINIDPMKLKPKTIIKKIRNAISHAGFDYSDKEKVFTFESGYEENGEFKKTFEAKISFENFRDLLLQDLANAWDTMKSVNKC